MHANSSAILEQNTSGKYLFGMVPTENFLFFGCNSLNIVYENLVLPSYPFFVPAVEE
jgi:hypothetical protein